MRSSDVLRSAIGFVSILGTACADTPAAPSPNEPGQVVAFVSGSLTAEYRGEGSFMAPPRTPGFQLWSRTMSEIGNCMGDGCSQLGLHREGGGIPNIGRHIIVAPAKQGATNLVGTFHHVGANSIVESYASLEGELVMIESQANHVEGSFWFVAYQYCRAAPVELPGVICKPPLDFDPQAPRITVTGTFKAFLEPDEPGIPQ